MTMNKKWKRFQKVGESQPRGVKGVGYTNRYHLCKTCVKMTKFKYMYRFSK
jgi:hypothetical protein